MSEADRLNAILASRAPALARTLSPLGRALAFPRGIPFQAGEARKARLNGTIGQVTDGAGNPLPLPVLAEAAGGLDPKVSFLYAPQPGHPEVRELWAARQRGLAGGATAPCTLPFATHGLTHGLAMAADLFVDADTTVIVPEPSWENYELVFTLRTGARTASYAFFDGEGFNLDGLSRTLEGVQGKAVVVLNFPSNPTGYAPTPAEADAIAARLAAHTGPLVVIVDDAYQGVVFEEGRLDHSLYWRIAAAVDPERTVVLKVDGATKELLLFPSRVGFLAANLVDAEAEAVWTNKLNALVRGTLGGPPGPSLALMLAGLRQPDRLQAEIDARREELAVRYRTLRDALAALDNPRLRPWPFNSAYFALVGLADGLDPDVIRQRLIAERSVGLIAIPEVNALRVAFCSTTPQALGEIVQHLDEVVASA
ncbi:MAG: aminotransferase class I/II-fold pyridoxal phosphate-dependent enzyme [Alphaproteobacteria bacterium]|nr:aminotransferase class I/II-fold pyridoxal phosphate-dependent enzyme [Alphaproteobacteria bacterium]